MDYSKLIDIGSKLSLAVVLMVILFGGVQGYWVAGTTYKDMVADRDTWKQLALKGTNLAQQTAVRTMNGPGPVRFSPLPTDAKASDVKARLDVIDSATKYKTEPTDTPIQ